MNPQPVVHAPAVPSFDAVSDTASEGIVWTYRLILDRDPSTQEMQDALHPGSADAGKLCRTLLKSTAFDQFLSGDETDHLLTNDGAVQAARWAFRILLGRELGDEATTRSFAANVSSLVQIRAIIALSEEFRLRDDRSLTSFLMGVLVRNFKPFPRVPAAPGSFRDFLGNTTRCSFLPAGFSAISGMVQGPPGSISFPPMHDDFEWSGTLRAALDATERFTIVELGAGWAPWLVAGCKAAKIRGINEAHLVGVEGSRGHVDYMRQNFLDNGLDPDVHQLLHGVVGVEDGVAYFPHLPVPGEDYGSAADYAGNREQSGMQAVKCYSLETLLRDLPQRIDIIHCDIQGSEADVMEASLELLDKRVRRVVIGTHGRLVEGRLLEMFSARGWRLEHEMVCAYRQEPTTGVLALSQDGTQVWRNPKI